MRCPLPATACFALLLFGCVHLEERDDRVRTRPVDARLDDLFAQSDPEEVLAFVRYERVGERDESRLALLELAKADALSELGQLLSALSSYSAAWHRLDGGIDNPLARDVLTGWGDAEARLGRWTEALRHYDMAVSASLVPEAELTASRAVAYERLGRPGDAALERQRLGASAAAHVARAEERLSRLGPMPSRAPARPHRVAGGIPRDPRQLLTSIHVRDEWNTRRHGVNYHPMSPVKSITVHHSAMEAPYRGGEVSQLRNIQREHMDGRGYADIAYHFLIDPSGGIWEGRALDKQGAHAGSYQSNLGNVGICLLGNFEQHRVPAAQVASLNELLDVLRGRFVVDSSQVFTHREWKNTQCPGRNLQATVLGYRAAARPTAALQ